MLDKIRWTAPWAVLAAGGVLVVLAFLWRPAELDVDTPSGSAMQIAELQRAITEGPYNETQRYRLGRLMLQHSPPDETVAYFSAALATDPKPQTSYYFMGSALAQKRKFREAFNHYRSGLEIDPAHELTELRWGTLLAQLGQNKQAIVHLKRAVEIHPEFKKAHLALANLHTLQGQDDKARHHEELAEASDPNTRKRFLYWGRALLKAERWEAAAAELKKALRVDPEDQEAKRLLEEALSAIDGKTP